MLLRHSAHYVFARGVPGLLSLAGVALYTRLLTPEEFGRYVLVVAGVGMGEVVVFQWLRLVLARFAPADRDEPQRLLGGIAALFLLLVAATGAIAVAAAAWVDEAWFGLFAAGVLLLVSQAWFELNLGLAATQLQTVRYGQLVTVRAVMALALGGWLATRGFGAYAPVLGLLAGQVVATLTVGLAPWRGVRPTWPATTVLRTQLSYGLPLTVTSVLSALVAGADRLLITGFLGAPAVALYAVGYDLSQQSIGLLLAVVNTAAYPLAVHALERDGVEAARRQLNENGALVFSIALAAAAGLVVLAPVVIDVIVGPELRDGARLVLPWIAVGGAIGGIKSFHLDIAFHLSRFSRGLLAASATAAAGNILLNLLLIPRFGIVGAAWASLLSFVLGASVSALLGRRVFSMPPLAPLAVRGFAVAAAVATGAQAWRLVEPAAGALVIGLAGGVGCGAAAALALDIGGVRAAVRRRWPRPGAGAAST
jgi:O-antigen/teichoic acid export membrane protein